MISHFARFMHTCYNACLQHALSLHGPRGLSLAMLYGKLFNCVLPLRKFGSK